MEDITEVARRIIEPLCEETGKLLATANLMPNDRLEVSLDDLGDAFIVQAYALKRKVKVRGNDWIMLGEEERTSASFAASIRWFKRVPERREAGYGRWVLKATDFTAIVMSAVWQPEHITFTEEAKVIYDFLLLRLSQQTLNSKRKALFKLDGVVPAEPLNWSDHPRLPLTPYQLTMHHTAVNTECAAYFAEQGTGKTPPAIARIMHEAKRVYSETGQMYRTIVVCPKNVRTNWKMEIIRFATTPGKVVVMKGGALDRVKQLVDVMTPDEDAQWSVVICSYETVKRSWNALRMIHWNLAIADESHYIKNPRAQRSKILHKLRDNADQRMCLTGTPYANSILDLYMQLEFLAPGMSGFSSPNAFREYYSKFVQQNSNGQTHRIQIGFKNLPLLQERLARIAFMIRKKEAMPDLPDQVYDILDAEMSPKQAEYYKALNAKLMLEIEADIKAGEAKGTNSKVTATHILTKLLRLAQITAGFIVEDIEYDDEGNELVSNRIHWFPDCPKMDMLIDILKEKTDKEKTLVWTWAVPAIKKIKERCDEAGLKAFMYYGATSDDDRDRIVKEFNEFDGKCVFIGNPAAGGVGLNLPGYVPDHEGTDADHGCNADHVIFYACNWSMIHRSQAEGRNHGYNRNRVPIRITDLCVPGTIDEEIRTRVQGKVGDAMQVQDIQLIMERLVNPTFESGD